MRVSTTPMVSVPASPACRARMPSLEALQIGEQLRACCLDLLAVLGQGEAGPAPTAEAKAEPDLQVLDRPADRREPHLQLGLGAREAAALGHRAEDPRAAPEIPVADPGREPAMRCGHAYRSLACFGAGKACRRSDHPLPVRPSPCHAALMPHQVEGCSSADPHAIVLVVGDQVARRATGSGSRLQLKAPFGIAAAGPRNHLCYNSLLIDI